MNDGNPRRRHRAAYFAPTRHGALHNEIDDPEAGLPEAGATPAVAQVDELAAQIEATDDETMSFTKVFSALCKSIVDLGLLVAIMFISFFLYDVEISVIKNGDEATTLRDNDVQGSRVVLRSEISDISSIRSGESTV